MGLFDRFKHKKEVEEEAKVQILEEEVKAQIPEERMRRYYKDCLETIEHFRKKCVANQREDLMKRILIPKSYEEYCQKNDYFLEQTNYILKVLPNIQAKENNQEKDDKPINNHPQNLTSTDDFYARHVNYYSSRKVSSDPSYRTINNINRALDNKHNKIMEAINTPEIRYSVYSTALEFDELLKREQQKGKQEKRKKLIQEIEKEYENIERFKENCKNYKSSYDFVNAIIKEIEEMHKISKSNKFDLFSEENDTSKLYLMKFCLLNEQERNKAFFLDTVSKTPNNINELYKEYHNAQSMYLKKRDTMSFQKQKELAFKIMYIDVFNNEKEYLAKNYTIKLGMTADEFSKKFISGYIEYQNKILEIDKKCEKMGMDILRFLDRNKMSLMNFQEYYKFPKKDSIATTLDNAISSEIKNNQKLLKELENNEKFKNNIKNYDDGIKFITSIRDKLTEVYLTTNDEAYNPNDETFIKIYCLMTEEERQANFKKAIASATENRELK